MGNYLDKFSGPYENRVAELLRYQKAVLDNMAYGPYGSAELAHIHSKHELLNHYDMTTGRLKRRITATIAHRKKAHTLLQDRMPTKTIDGLFAHSNGLLMAGGYNAADRAHMITLASAIWILDQLNLQGDLHKAFPYLPEVDEDEIVCLYVTHPQYEVELIESMVKLLLYRNCDSYGGLKPTDTTLVSDSQEKGALRGNFDAIVNLLDQKAIETAIKKYEDKVWEFYRLALSADGLIDKELDKLSHEIDTLEKAAAPSVSPILLMRPGVLQFPGNTRDNTKIELLQLKYQQLCTDFTLTAVGMPNSREKVAKRFSDIFGTELSEQIKAFSVDDPFEMAFALFYLLDSGSNIPWLFYGSISVTYTLIDQLPFDTNIATRGDSGLQSDLIKNLYTHRFSGYRWDNELDCDSEPVRREKATNLAQLLYENGFGVYPRITRNLPQLEQYFADLDLENDAQKEPYQLLLHLISSGVDRAESLRTYWAVTHVMDVVSEIPTDTEDVSLLHERIEELSQQYNSLRRAFYDETRLKRDALKDLHLTKEENNQLRQELADLRNLVFSQQTEDSTEPEIETTLRFPAKTTGRIVSFGGHPNWIREMKALLPNVMYFSADVIPNKDILRNAHEVWIQAQYIPHSAFYRIISALGQGTQLRYFSSKSARSCAEQLVKSERNF